MNDIKYTSCCEPAINTDLSEIELQVDNICKDVSVIHYQMMDMVERLKSILAPEYPQNTSSDKDIRCSVSPLGINLESIHINLQNTIYNFNDLTRRLLL